MNSGTIDITLFLFATTGIITFLAVLIVSVVYIHQKNRILHEKIINSLKIDHEHQLTVAQLEIQESTCQSISREIHDNINLSLTLAKLNLNTFEWGNRNKALDQLQSTIQIIGNVICELSDISKSLNSEMIEGLGLVSAIENEIDRIRTTNIFKIHFDIIGNPIVLQTQSELTIFRIIQEAFNNIIKHANATLVKLDLQYLDNLLILQIIDDGKGFDPFANVRGKSNGLRNMLIRSRMLKGHMSINSKKGIGTTIAFRIPFQ
jgi:two-component system NarL family sensor kinase